METTFKSILEDAGVCTEDLERRLLRHMESILFPQTAYMVYNNTSTAFFRSRESAEKYAGKGGAASGMKITVIDII